MKKKLLIVLLAVCIAITSVFAIACDTDENTVEMDGFKFKLLRDGTYKVAKYKGDATEVIIPSTCDGIKVTGIGDFAFRECWKITSVTLPDEITSIGFGAFDNCRKLTSINIPEGITSIETNTFNCCYALTGIPYFIIKVTPLLTQGIVKENIVPCRSRKHHPHPYSIGTVFLNQIQWVGRITQRLGHLTS